MQKSCTENKLLNAEMSHVTVFPLSYIIITDAFRCRHICHVPIIHHRFPVLLFCVCCLYCATTVYGRDWCAVQHERPLRGPCGPGRSTRITCPKYIFFLEIIIRIWLRNAWIYLNKPAGAKETQLTSQPSSVQILISDLFKKVSVSNISVPCTCRSTRGKTIKA